MLLTHLAVVQPESIPDAHPVALVVLGVAAAAALFGIAVVGSVVRRVVSFLVFAAVAILIVSLVVKGDPFGIDLDFLRKPIEEKSASTTSTLGSPMVYRALPTPRSGSATSPPFRSSSPALLMSSPNR